MSSSTAISTSIITAGPNQPAPSGVPWREYDLVIERCVSTSRGLYALAILE